MFKLKVDTKHLLNNQRQLLLLWKKEVYSTEMMKKMSMVLKN